MLRGIVEPHGPSFFDTLVEDNLRARYVQDISTFEYFGRLEELAGFFRDQRWMHMHAVLRSQGITFEELGRRGPLAALASLEAQGFSEASTEFAKRGRRGALASIERQGFTGKGGTASTSTELGNRGCGGALASLEAQGFTGEDGTRTASTELGHRGRGGSLASLEAQGYTGEGGEASASTELGRRGGEAYSAIYRVSGNCAYPGCTLAIRTGEFCEKHHPKKPEKSDKCRVCGQVFVAKERVRGGVCNTCYNKPETVAIRKKATAAKKVTRKTCSTPGCPRITDRGTDKCRNCLYPQKYSK